MTLSQRFFQNLDYFLNIIVKTKKIILSIYYILILIMKNHVKDKIMII